MSDSMMDGSAVDEETQATLLLRNVLDPQNSTFIGALDSPCPLGRVTQTDTRSSVTSRKYDYHGLASTQSTLLVDRTEGGVAGSFENPPSSVQSHTKAFQQDKGPRSANTKFDEKLNPVNKVVSFQSPSSKPKAGASGARLHPPTRSTALSGPRAHASRSLQRDHSEDSFAGDFHIDPAQEYLASSKRFGVPLSELKRIAETSNAVASPDRTPIYSPMRRRVPPKQPTRCSPPEGKILVESTPSLSGGSQSHLSEDEQPPQPVQIETSYTQHNGDLSRQDTEEYLSGSDGPSSSYLANLELRCNDFPEGGSQMQPTQPSTQIQTQLDEPPDEVNNETSIPDSATSSRKRAPVSNLLNLVSPSKRHRYRHYIQTSTTKSMDDSIPENNTQSAVQPSEELTDLRQPLTGCGAIRPFSNNLSNHSAEPEQTQLVEEHRSEPSIPRRRFPTKSTNPNSSKVSSSNRTTSAQDIVPDSEPQEEPQLQNHDARITKRVPSSSRQSRRSSSADDIVPDSMDVDIDEEGLTKTTDKSPTKTISPLSGDDDDDAPLAWNLATKQTQPKQGHVVWPTSEEVSKESNKQVAQSTKLGTTPAAKQRRTAVTLPNSWQDGVVPSSIQEEQIILASGPSSRASSKAPKSKGKGKVPAASRATTRRSKRRRKSAGDGEDEDGHSGTESEDEKRTVSDKASTYGAQESEQVQHKTNGSRKRKRTGTTKAIPTPVTRQTRRLQSVLTASISGSKNATRIFGFWKPDGYWYPGTIVNNEGDGRYKVLFDDSAETILSLDHLRSYILQVGDIIIPHRFRVAAKVVDTSKFSDGVVSVEIDDDVDEIPVQDIKIHKTSVNDTFSNRSLNADIIMPLQPKRTLSSTPSRASIANLAPDTSRAKWLGHTAIVVTAASSMNASNREPILDCIKRYGGTVLEDWSSLLHMTGKHDIPGQQRWSIRRSDVHWVGKSNIERVFLLGDQPNAKAKYLLALAIGIPCVSFSWLNDKADNPITRWPAHLLPQGDSEELSACLSQQVNLLWGTEKHDVTKMFETSTTFKLFDKSSVLCIGPEVFPQRISFTARLNDIQKQAAFNAVTQIILAMGADYVEAVPNVKYSSKAPTHYDYIVIKKPEEYDSAYRGTTVVLWKWVKDCLIASRKLPLPKWDLQEDEYSQEI